MRSSIDTPPLHRIVMDILDTFSDDIGSINTRGTSAIFTPAAYFKTALMSNILMPYSPSATYSLVPSSDKADVVARFEIP